MPTYEKNFLKCPVCGINGPRRCFTRGAFGHNLQALKQQFVGRNRGTGGVGSGMIWTRRPMTHEELEHVARAVTKATEMIAEHVELLDCPDNEELFASLDDDEATEVGLKWIEEAREELSRRERIFTDRFKRE